MPGEQITEIDEGLTGAPTYIVAGYGKFGTIAVERLHRKFRAVSLLVLERDPDRMKPELPHIVSGRIADAAQYLAHTSFLLPDSIIIPTVPFHLAARFLTARVSGTRQVPIPAALSLSAPGAHLLDDSNLSCSRSDFLCPDDCPESDPCSMTGEFHDPLYEELEKLCIPGFQTVVLRSFQVLPGVGGYFFRDLCDIENRARPGFNLIATACKCHGIITALWFSK